MKPRFKFLTGDINWQQYGGTWLSQKLNNGEFDYWLAIRVMNWEDATGEKPDGNTYNVDLVSVSPSEAGSENLKRAFACIGQEEADSSILSNHVCQCDALLSYGVYAPLWSADGRNIKKLMAEARKQALISCSLYGFYMDAPKNAIGNSGWACQRGEIGFKRAAE